MRDKKSIKGHIYRNILIFKEKIDKNSPLFPLKPE
jgi:hypothetical protein|nr:MAG TPA: hypothetical protein [Caudoviricetes sp.]